MTETTLLKIPRLKYILTLVSASLQCLVNPRSTLFMDGPMKEIIVVKIKAVHASRKRRRRGCAAWRRWLCGARGLCATYDIKRIAFAKTAEEWPSRPCSRTFMAFRDSVLCTVLAGSARVTLILFFL